MSAEPVPVPVAWWHVAENGSIRCWTSAHADVLRLASEIGVHLMPLYDRATLNAAVAAARAEERASFPNLMPVIEWLERGGDPAEAAKELRVYHYAVRIIKQD